MHEEKLSLKGKYNKWLKGFKGANPKEDFDARHKHTIRNLSIGAVIVVVALVICIYQVATLQETYISRLSDEFQSHHVTVAAGIDSVIATQSSLLEVAAESIAKTTESASDNRIQQIIGEYEHIDGITSLCYIDKDGSVQDAQRTYKASQVKTEVDQYLAMTDEKETRIYITSPSFTSKLWSAKERRIIISCPVRSGKETRGYVVGTISLKAFLDREILAYQNEMGECYLLDADGLIAARSAEAAMISAEENDFEKGMLAYSDGKEQSKQALRQLAAERKDADAGYVNLITNKGNSLQLSYCGLSSIEGVMFVSCYNDNVVDDMVQPMIFKNVLSCTIIIVLMISIVVFVWASAKRSNAMIEKLAFEDPVTKGKNVNYFKEFANMVLNIYTESSFMIYRFDIANFRYINEVYGHYKADKILKAVISVFDECFDTRELCVRMNADQFIAIVVNDGALEERMERFKDEVNSAVKADGIKYPIRFKIGECQFSKHDQDIDVVIDHANVARKTLSKDDTLRHAKYSGKVIDEMNRVESIEQHQESALSHKEFKVYMQPKWDIFENRVAGAEALVRWTRSSGKIMKPEEFIPIFEKNGFIERLDFHMLEEVCRFMRETVDAGGIVYPVSVNQSRLLLHSPDYVENVKKILAKYNIPPGSIELEITESVFEEDREEMIGIMNELRAFGIKLAMDDFGSGYSSLNMLKDIPLDVVKIDKDFFSETVNGEKSRWILQKVIEMADGLGMEVVCEGVENAEQVEVLRFLKCRIVQGFYYEKPIPAEEYMKKYSLGIHFE